jgi:1,4-alpha-glucan branching enzyme
VDAILTKSDKDTWQSGNHDKAYEHMGSHLTEKGAHFAVWAPHAYSVSVVGEFNNWDGRENPMQKDESTGIWTAFVPGVEQWTLYKYELKTGKDTAPFLKSDPYAHAMVVRLKTASLVYNLDDYDWDDQEWIESREERQSFRKPISVYEVHLASCQRK